MKGNIMNDKLIQLKNKIRPHLPVIVTAAAAALGGYALARATPPDETHFLAIPQSQLDEINANDDLDSILFQKDHTKIVAVYLPDK
jgi:hypothetical protein